MNRADCRTGDEIDVLTTYRRYLRRKGATPFGAAGLALREILDYRVTLSPNFVERFTDGDRAMTVDGKIVLTEQGRSRLADLERGCVDPMPVAVFHNHDGHVTRCGLAMTEMPPLTEIHAVASCLDCWVLAHPLSTVEAGRCPDCGKVEDSSQYAFRVESGRCLDCHNLVSAP